MKIVFLEADSLGEDMKLDHFFEIGEVVIYGKTTVEQVPERIAEADAVIVNKLPMNKETLAGAGFLKYIGLTATGVNNIDFDYTNKRGITVTNVAGYSTEVVAQHTFAMMFYLLEHLRYYDDYVKSGKYVKSESFCHMDRRFTELAGKTWGIIGLGAIGRKVAEIATAFGCKVICYSASGSKYDSPYEQVDFDELLARSDILSVHAPLNAYTENLMTLDAFKKMKKSSIFINVARGAIVNEADLYTALSEDIIAGAALDVVCKEPMDPENPLLKIQDSNKLIITPHIAWAAKETRFRVVDEVAKNIEGFFIGETKNRVC